VSKVCSLLSVPTDSNSSNLMIPVNTVMLLAVCRDRQENLS
jgi:hypothetical protein